MTEDYNKTDGLSPTTRKLAGYNSRKTQSPLSLRPPYPTTYTLPTESDLPACGPPASFSVHLASSAVTPVGSVHKSRSGNVVRMWV